MGLKSPYSIQTMITHLIIFTILLLSAIHGLSGDSDSSDAADNSHNTMF